MDHIIWYNYYHLKFYLKRKSNIIRNVHQVAPMHMEVDRIAVKVFSSRCLVVIQKGTTKVTLDEVLVIALEILGPVRLNLVPTTVE